MSETLPPACSLSVCQVYVQLLVKCKSYLYFVNVHVNSKSEICIVRADGLWLHAVFKIEHVTAGQDPKLRVKRKY